MPKTQAGTTPGGLWADLVPQYFMGFAELNFPVTQGSTTQEFDVDNVWITIKKKVVKKFGKRKNRFIFVLEINYSLNQKKIMAKKISVQYTQHLGMFKFHNVNREVDAPRIKRITNSMIKDGLKLVPIIVTSNYTVVDGQHRLEAAKVAGKGIYYLVDSTIPNTTKGIFEAARKFNQNMKEWGKKDYIHGFSEQGNKSYKILEDFSKEFPMFSLTERIMLLQNSGTRHVDKQDFADGKFSVANLESAKEWANNLLQLKPYFEKGYNKSVFVRTLLTIVEKKPEFKFEEFLHKVKLRPSSIFMCGDKKSYAEMIEDIYNYKRRNDEKLNLRF